MQDNCLDSHGAKTAAATDNGIKTARLGWLQPLFAPQSLAIFGASDRPETVGRQLLIHASMGGFAGTVWPINPRLRQIEGRDCLRDASDLPAAPDLAILAVSDHNVEAAAGQAIAAGARALIAVGALASDPLLTSAPPGGSAIATDNAGDPHRMDDQGSALKQRLLQIARSAGIPLLGGNSMGIYRFDLGLWACGFPTRSDHRAGGVSLITQSGSVFNALVDSDARIDFNFIASPGQELDVTMEDALEQALALDSTRVIGMFIETARRPDSFRAQLEIAANRNIPIVAIKVGRTEAASRLAVSHSGAMTGNDDAWTALFAHYGVLRARALDEMAAMLIMLSAPRKASPGGLATIHDSGGERGLLLDLAGDAGVPFARISPATQAKLAQTLDPGLPAVNPLDAWGRGHDYENQFTELLGVLASDPDTAIAAVVGDRGPDGAQFDGVLDVGARVYACCEKPVFVVANHQGTGTSQAGIAVSRRGIPVLDGIPEFLSGVRSMLQVRDAPARWLARRNDNPPEIATSQLASARAALSNAAMSPEQRGLAMLDAVGIPVVAHRHANSLAATLASAKEIGYPIALKTAVPGILHKSDCDGVVLGITDPPGLRAAYQEMAARLGPEVLVARMYWTHGVELMIGSVFDPQWGPIVAVGIGGIHAEILGDVAHALPPFGPAAACQLLSGLRLARMLEGARGGTAIDKAAVATAISRFSVLVAELGEAVCEFDLNPLLATAEGCIALDAMAETKASSEVPEP